MAPIIYFLIPIWWFIWYNFQIMQYDFELLFLLKCLLHMMVKTLRIKVDSNYQAFHHWIVLILSEKWYLKVSFGGNFGATGSSSDWLQNFEIEALIFMTWKSENSSVHWKNQSWFGTCISSNQKVSEWSTVNYYVTSLLQDKKGK